MVLITALEEKSDTTLTEAGDDTTLAKLESNYQSSRTTGTTTNTLNAQKKSNKWDLNGRETRGVLYRNFRARNDQIR